MKIKIHFPPASPPLLFSLFLGSHKWDRSARIGIWAAAAQGNGAGIKHTHTYDRRARKKVGGRGRERSKSELSWAKGEEGEKEVPGEKWTSVPRRRNGSEIHQPLANKVTMQFPAILHECQARACLHFKLYGMYLMKSVVESLSPWGSKRLPVGYRSATADACRGVKKEINERVLIAPRPRDRPTDSSRARRRHGPKKRQRNRIFASNASLDSVAAARSSSLHGKVEAINWLGEQTGLTISNSPLKIFSLFCSWAIFYALLFLFLSPLPRNT